MKKNNIIRFLIVIIVSSLIFPACDKSNPTGTNELGGETNLQLTKVGSVSSAYWKIGNKQVPTGSMTVTSNTDGIVVYKLNVNLKGSPDSASISKLLPDKYKDAQGNVFMDFKFKITSDGIQDFFRRDRPWTLVKYSDGVGTVYPFTTDNGENLKRTITEKTGLDDFPMGYMYIKTSKIESDLPATDKTAKRIIYRTNHKFGLVQVILILLDDTQVTLNVIPYFMIQ